MKRKNRCLSPIFLLFLGACSGKPDVPGKTTLRILSAPDTGGGQKAVIARFEELHPDIHVELVEGPAATDVRENMYSTSFLAGESTYDTLYMDLAWMPKFAHQGWLKPLDEFLKPEQARAFLPPSLEASRYQGRTYMLPAQSDAGLLYYRRDLLDQAGLAPPRTWDELVETSKKLQDPPRLWGFVFQGQQYEGLVCDYLEFLWGNGGDVLDSGGSVLLDRPEAVQALKWMVDAVRKDKISPEAVLTYQEEESRHAFQEGRAVFMRNWPYAWILLQKEGSPVRDKVGIVPMVHGKGRSAATLGGWGYAISSFTKHPEAAWKYVSFAAGAEAQRIAYHRSGIPPSLTSLYTDPEILRSSPHYPEVVKILSVARPRPVVPAYPRISDSLQIHLSAALSGREDPAQAMSAAAKEIRAILGNPSNSSR